MTAEGLTEALSAALRQAAREHIGLHEGEFWPSSIADAQADVVERILADRLAAVQAEHSPGETCAEADERFADTWARAKSAEAERDAARAECDALRERVEAVLPAECWVTRHAEMVCTDMIGGGFTNGAKFTEGMCCVPCRVRAALDADRGSA